MAEGDRALDPEGADDGERVITEAPPVHRRHAADGDGLDGRRPAVAVAPDVEAYDPEAVGPAEAQEARRVEAANVLGRWPAPPPHLVEQWYRR